MCADRTFYRFIETENARMRGFWRRDYSDPETRQFFQQRLLQPFSEALKVLSADGPVYDLIHDSFTVRSLAELVWQAVADGSTTERTQPEYGAIPYQFTAPEDFAPDELLAEFAARLRSDDELGFVSEAVDLPTALTDHWCPATGTAGKFGTRSNADLQIRLGLLGPRGSFGTGVNIVLADSDGATHPVGTVPDGWVIAPGTGNVGLRTAIPIGHHTAMMIRNINDVAPAARIFVLGLLPDQIIDLPAFLSRAQAAFWQVYQDITTNAALPGGRWILVNPWNVYDRRLDTVAPKYADDPNHPFTRSVTVAVDTFGFDVVFSAGNCGQFSPDQRCGPNDAGPGASLFGAGSLAHVVTVGAVRADDVWLGYSSQGPGPAALGADKPDFCSPSQFCETDNAALLSSGTSAACGIAAGVMAALRGPPRPYAQPPNALRQLLRTSARRVPGLPADPMLRMRLGSGILDARAAWLLAGKP